MDVFTWPCLTIGYTARPYDLMIPRFPWNRSNIHALAYHGVLRPLLISFTLLDYAAIPMTTFLFDYSHPQCLYGHMYAISLCQVMDLA